MWDIALQLPPTSTVRRYFYDWRNNSLLYEINRYYIAAACQAECCQGDLSAGVIDDQSVKTTEGEG